MNNPKRSNGRVEKKYTTRSFVIVLLTMIGGICSTNEEDEKCVHDLVGESEEKDSLQDLNVDGTVILRRVSLF
jgi:hypothetical protein